MRTPGPEPAHLRSVNGDGSAAFCARLRAQNATDRDHRENALGVSIRQKWKILFPAYLQRNMAFISSVRAMAAPTASSIIASMSRAFMTAKARAVVPPLLVTCSRSSEKGFSPKPPGSPFQSCANR